MKLLFVNSSLTDGGSERAMSLVAEAMVTRGHDVTMVLVREKERSYSVDPRIKLVQFSYAGKGKALKSLMRAQKLRNLTRSESFDYIISYMWDINITTLVATLGLGSRIVVSERGFPGSSSRSKLTRWLERVTYRFAHRIVYQTEGAQEFCPSHLVTKSVVIPNIVNATALGTIFEGLRDKRIVSVGRLTEQKNYPLLLTSFAKFRHTQPDWVLEIFGRGPLEADLKNLAQQLGVQDAVTFAGYADDVATRISDAGMFVLSSDFEGISNAMSEAMALGLPVVCTDCPVGGAALMIEDGVSGKLVPVGDKPALVSAMNEIASDPALANRLSSGARASVERFSPKRMSEKWEKSVFASC